MESKKKTTLSKTTRLASFLVYPLLFLIFSLSLNGGACGVGCMSNMFMVVLLLITASLLAAGLNGCSLLLDKRPASTLRSLEFALFGAPAVLSVLLLIEMAVENF